MQGGLDRAVTLALIAATLTLTSCTSPPPARAPLRIMAAASLAEVVPAIGAQWTAQTGQPVEVELAGSSRHARRLLAGATADVFISASPRWLDATAQAGLVVPGSRTTVARNALVLARPANTPPITLDRLHTARRVALAGEAVPAGRYAREALRRAALWEGVAPVVIEAADVRGALAWLTRGEADAGIVYRTDGIAAGATVRFEPLPDALQPDIRYVGAALRTGAQAEAGARFLVYARGPEARHIWQRAGFLAAPEREDASATAASVAPRLGVGVDVGAAVRLSLWVALLCVLLGLGPAVAMGYVLARFEFRGKALLSAAALVPLVVPPVVTGLGVLALVGRRGALGSWLARLGVDLTMSEAGAVLAALVVGFPLYMLSARAAFEAVDPRLEALSRSMGHSAWRTFWRVTLPLAAPGVAAGAVLAFGRALGEFGATIVLAGNAEGRTRTIALAIYTALESPGQEPTAERLALASVALALGSVIGYEALHRWQRRRLYDGR